MHQFPATLQRGTSRKQREGMKDGTKDRMRGGYTQPPHKIGKAGNRDCNDIVRLETLKAHVQCSRRSITITRIMSQPFNIKLYIHKNIIDFTKQ